MEILKILKRSISLALNSLRDARRQDKGKRVIQKMKISPPVRIEFGASGRREGWITIGFDKSTDIVFDIRDKIPFADNCVDEIYTSHLLEHLTYNEIILFLKNCKRILKVGAAIKICVPDTSVYWAMANDNSLFEKYIDEPLRKRAGNFGELIERANPFFKFHSPLSILNYIAYMDGQHKYMFDRDEIVSILDTVGFSFVSERDFDPGLDLEIRRWESLYVTAIK